MYLYKSEFTALQAAAYPDSLGCVHYRSFKLVENISEAPSPDGVLKLRQFIGKPHHHCMLLPSAN